MKSKISFLMTFSVALATSTGHTREVDSQTSAAEFRAILQDTTGFSKAQLNDLHFIPKQGGRFDQALNAASLKEAIQLNRGLTLKEIRDESENIPAANAISGDQTLLTNPVTVVIVPGVFGEFIPIDPFEEYFGPGTTSKFRDAFVARAKSSGQKLPTFLLKKGNYTQDITELVHVGSLRTRDGRKELAPVVVFHTMQMSLESLGKIEDRAQIFTDRLNEYLRLTGPDQKLLFVGYSRGTVVGLEMLARATENRVPWIKNVVGMVSLGGVVWGSSLADATNQRYIDEELAPRTDVSDDTKKAAAITARQFQRLKEHRNNLIASGAQAAHNLSERWNFLRDLGGESFSGRRLKKAKPEMAELKQGAPVTLSLDAGGMFKLAKDAWSQFDWIPFMSYASDINRLKYLLTNVIDAAEGMQTEVREKWFAGNTLPQNVTYYSIVAAMANPDASDFEKRAFMASDGGYANTVGGRLAWNFDDTYLLQGRLDYEAATTIPLNDSQVSSIQASFVPGAIEHLNPQNGGLRTKFLGIMGTHHWGLALRVVNEMRSPRVNPFPREALLKALAVQASLDSRK